MLGRILIRSGVMFSTRERCCRFSLDRKGINLSSVGSETFLFVYAMPWATIGRAA